MLIELLNELLSEASPFYFYVSMMLAIYCAFGFSVMAFPSLSKSSEMVTRDYHAIQFRLLPVERRLTETGEVITWIARKIKRKDGPEDDTDNHSFSLTNQKYTLRGGQQWKNILYSLPFKRADLSL
ncbi:hypothetical protein ERJ70_10735 [Sediminibacillus dalangtanensis]|uniref:Uncharacterized protein n=1 Tax=Sediminibacillus dalangtanensis TaxID=2729421 RepID=A0ABX7VS89_9BACI|nr:hypothetical protein [Sediminibacillus dalangtanensis]QTM99734.1 hypothetical protein ERJ70_10735 [Sediminibacillus dalangtanensis]